MDEERTFAEEAETQEPVYQSEAERVRATRSHCNYCGDDPDFVFLVRAHVFDLEGALMTGQRVCDLCLGRQEFTGWAIGVGGWPVRDPLGRAKPPEYYAEPPLDWREIGAALEGQQGVLA